MSAVDRARLKDDLPPVHAIDGRGKGYVGIADEVSEHDSNRIPYRQSTVSDLLSALDVRFHLCALHQPESVPTAFPSPSAKKTPPSRSVWKWIARSRQLILFTADRNVSEVMRTSDEGANPRRDVRRGSNR